MRTPDQYLFKIASEECEFEQIHRLNYRTFVEEIPQHAGNEEQRLVDKFHHENTYVICLEQGKLLGMIALRDRRPFSLDAKLEALDSYLPAAKKLCEIRLLAIEKGYRHNTIFPGLLTRLSEYADGQGYDLGLISGTLRQTKLYRHIGFVPFGPLVGTPGAEYQPMYLSFAAYRSLKERSPIFSLKGTGQSSRQIANFLPGPVTVNSAVLNAMAKQPQSHRGKEFHETMDATRQQLCKLVKAEQVQILMGSGTLANDAVAAQLTLEEKPGLILINGEFGRRLADHAERLGLTYSTLSAEEGQPFDSQQICALLTARPEINWLWATHCETSTGVLNDIQLLREICDGHDVRLCLDCISSIGTVPLDLNGVYLASGVSGKAIGSLPGLAFVFHQHELEPKPKQLPRYLDLGVYASNDGVPYTISSNQIEALHAALTTRDWTDYYAKLHAWSSRMHQALTQIGLPALAAAEISSPAVVSVELPSDINSLHLGEWLEAQNIFISYRSEYLQANNRIQFCMMGELIEDIDTVITALKAKLSRQEGVDPAAAKKECLRA